MLTGVHFLLTYQCSYQCDHCFLFCSPQSQGTFTADQVKHVLEESRRIGTVKEIYFEGGEPFLFFPIMVQGVRWAREMGFKVGLVSNAYWATSVDDAKLWLNPLAQAGLDHLSVSDDVLHRGETDKPNPAKIALTAASQLGLEARGITLAQPCQPKGGEHGHKGQPIEGGAVRMRGRAVETFARDLPTHPGFIFDRCPDEDLNGLSRVHVDAFGWVHLCQGLVIGNFIKKPLAEIIRDYRPERHPIIHSLHQGGPAQLARDFQLHTDASCVEACHLCYLIRRDLQDRFPNLLAPRQVYSETR